MATINCTNPEVEISGNTTVVGASYSWIGPNSFSSDLANPMVSDEGTYTLVISGPNGCTAMMDALVETDLEEPEISVTGGILTCASPTFTIPTSSSDPGISYSSESFH